MRLIGRTKLNGMSRGDPVVLTWVVAWVAELQAANWRKPTDALKQFPSAKQRSDGIIFFPCDVAGVGICVCFLFSKGIALICGIDKND